MKLDRDLQKAILSTAAERYPRFADASIAELEREQSMDSVHANLNYLAEHGLLLMKERQHIGPGVPLPYNIKITASGLDFLADDGGLSAILGVVTIKMHEDTIKGLIEAHIEADTSLPLEKKSKMVEAVRALPAKAVEKVATKGIEYALAHGSDWIHWIAQYLPKS
ncbi:hypothetical protein [Robbsia sp. KACC 23696]|uniref:hypothetical protein n=1 Tax=Robbsia sp. KACC 23696 TaxID=3149231 RepID=UPI00325B15C4